MITKLISLALTTLFLTLPAFASTKAESIEENMLRLMKQVDQQKEFAIFSGNTGMMSYVSEDFDGCKFKYRDKIRLQASSGKWVTYSTTRIIDFAQINMVSTAELSDPTYFEVIPNGLMDSILNTNVIEEIEGEAPVTIAPYTSTESYIRFDDRARADKALQAAQALLKLCRQ